MANNFPEFTTEVSQAYSELLIVPGRAPNLPKSNIPQYTKFDTHDSFYLGCRHQPQGGCDHIKSKNPQKVLALVHAGVDSNIIGKISGAALPGCRQCQVFQNNNPTQSSSPIC